MEKEWQRDIGKDIERDEKECVSVFVCVCRAKTLRLRMTKNSCKSACERERGK